MKKLPLKWRPVLLLALSLLAPSRSDAADPLRVASVPWLAPEKLQLLYAPTVGLLERKLKMPVEFQIAQDYGDLTQRVAAGACDVAIYGAASYVLAKYRLPGLRYLVTSMQPDDHYWSLVFVRKDSVLSRLTESKGHAIGFTDKQSTSGFRIPRVMFGRAGVDVERDARVFLLGSHDRVFEAVSAGMIDIGAADSSAWQSAVRAHGDVYRVIARSRPIPRNPVAAAPHVNAHLAAQIQNILAQAGADPQFARESGELKGYRIRSDEFYDPIREISR